MSKNIRYNSSEIANYFSQNRIKWDELYYSEKKVFEYLKPKKNSTILDIGCGCGGLGLILKEQFEITSYLGIEINSEAAKKATLMNDEATIINQDFLEVDLKNKFDFVISLSCIDWNIEFQKMIKKAWLLVKDEGYLLLSLRLTKEKGVNNISKSYQFINYQGDLSGEKAPYVVLNFNEWFQTLKNFEKLSEVYAFGYYGTPSVTAITPYKDVCFAVFSLKKQQQKGRAKLYFDLPIDIQDM